MIQASINNCRDYDRIADALVAQHPTIHLEEQPSSSSGGKGDRGKGKGKSRFKGKKKHNPFKKRFPFKKSHAHLADGDDYEEWEEKESSHAYVGGLTSDPAYWSGDEDYQHEDPSDTWDWDEFQAYITDEWDTDSALPSGEVDDPVDRAEMECMACVHDMIGDDAWSYPEHCAKFIQEGAAAYAAHKGGKGKGKRKGKGKYPIRPSNLSIEDRRKKLAELKAKTECRDCGRVGIGLAITNAP